MRRIIALIMVVVLALCGCSTESKVEQQAVIVSDIEASADGANNAASTNVGAEGKNKGLVESWTEDVTATKFTCLDDPALIKYLEDEIYASIEANFPIDQCVIEDISAIYISKEYLDELDYNSRSNIYFGYSLDEIESQMNGQKYIFTLGVDGTTTVQTFEEYDDTFDQIVRNVAIGTGVILLCVTVSVITGGVGAPAVAMVFAASAKTAATCAASSALIGGVASATITGIQTGDMKEALKAGALSASEGYAMGALVGSITGGTSELLLLKNVAKETTDIQYVDGKTPSYRQSELDVLNKYGGTEQKSFLNGDEVPWGTPHATRPDVVRLIDGKLEAIEVKNYNLASYNSRQGLYSTLREQVASRCQNLPENSLQRIVLDVRGRDFPPKLIEEVTTNIQASCSSYPDIPIDILH